MHIRTLILLLLAPAWSCLAQEARGTILGRVTDASGAVVPGITVQITNEATNIPVSLITNEQGIYQAPLLLPGTYRIAASGNGFKNYVRSGIELRVDDRLDINVRMELGAVTDTVTVTEETPLLESTSASLGEVVDARRVADLPIAHGNPFNLVQIAAGVNFVGNPQWDRSYEPAWTVSYAMGGARGNRSEVSLDGVSNTATTANGGVVSAYVPPADVVGEFKVQTAIFDASVGQSEGGAVNVSLKSGGNNFHGTAYYAKMAPEWNANLFFANRSGDPIGNFDYNRWGASGTGPVYIPKLYNGRNRTFYTYGYEGISESRPRGNTLTVPTAAEREGDFSALLKLGARYQIYDPFTRRRASNGRFEADPLPNNIIAKSRLSPQALGILKYYPLPTAAGTADGRNNLPMPNEPEPLSYYNHIARVDHYVSPRQRVFFRGNIYTRTSHFNDWFHNEATGTYFQSLARGGMVDDVYTISPTFIINMRFGYSRFVQYNDGPPSSHGFDITKLGFPQAYNDAIPADLRRFPQIAITGYTGTTNAQSWLPSEVYSLPVSIDKVQGAHSLKIGGEFRAYRQNQYKPDAQSTGYFAFGTAYTQGPYNNSPASPIGQGLASMLFGIVTNGWVERRASFAEQSTAWSVYFQDDWKISPRLTLNLGLRYELEGPLTERFDRSVRSFDPNAPLPIAAAATAAYAANPDSALPASQFQVRGGLNFPGVNGAPRTLWDRDTNNFMPRFGFAYRAGNNTVIRGGYGLFFGFLGTRRTSVDQYGFSERTNLVATSDEISFDVRLSNPFPNGIREPLGAANGAMTYAGQAISFFNNHPLAPYMQRWQLGFQHELPHRILLDFAYVGNRGTHVATARNINALPEQYYSRSLVRDQANIDFLTANFSNPFLGLLPNTARSGTTMTRANLLRPYPQFNDIAMDTNEGYSWYHSAQAIFQKRFSAGWTLNASYSFSKFMEATSFLNATDAKPYRVISDQDRPQRISASFIYELPFGRGRALLRNARGVAGAIVSGWQYQGIFVRQSGQPLDFGNIIFNGDLHDIPLPAGQRTAERWFNVNAGFERDTKKQLQWNYRTFPLRLSGVRGAGANNWDMSLIKNSTLREGVRFQFRMEFLNALNHPWLAAPAVDPYSTAFGSITAQQGYARRVQLGLKLLY